MDADFVRLEAKLVVVQLDLPRRRDDLAGARLGARPIGRRPFERHGQDDGAGTFEGVLVAFEAAEVVRDRRMVGQS